MISERGVCSVQDEENGPQYWALRHELWCDKHELLNEVDYICLRDMTEITGVQ